MTNTLLLLILLALPGGAAMIVSGLLGLLLLPFLAIGLAVVAFVLVAILTNPLVFLFLAGAVALGLGGVWGLFWLFPAPTASAGPSGTKPTPPSGAAHP